MVWYLTQTFPPIVEPQRRAKIRICLVDAYCHSNTGYRTKIRQQCISPLYELRVWICWPSAIRTKNMISNVMPFWEINLLKFPGTGWMDSNNCMRVWPMPGGLISGFCLSHMILSTALNKFLGICWGIRLPVPETTASVRPYEHRFT